MANINIDYALEKLKKDGVVLIENYLDDCGPILSEYDTLFSRIPLERAAVLERDNGIRPGKENSYTLGKHLRVPPESYINIPTIFSAFNNASLRTVTHSYLGPNKYAMQIFMSHEYNVVSDENLWPRNAFLHFDPYASLKFVLYLTNTNTENGAFSAIPGTKSEGKNYRENFLDLNDHTGWHGGCKHRPVDYEKSPKYCREDATHYCGSAGDLIIVDTDVLHFGSIIKKEALERKIILVHNRPS